jgi:hypothetical protein
MCELTSAVSGEFALALAITLVWSFAAGWALGRFGGG